MVPKSQEKKGTKKKKSCMNVINEMKPLEQKMSSNFLLSDHAIHMYPSRGTRRSNDFKAEIIKEETNASGIRDDTIITQKSSITITNSKHQDFSKYDSIESVDSKNSVSDIDNLQSEYVITESAKSSMPKEKNIEETERQDYKTIHASISR